MVFKDLFSGHATDYAKHRPLYPKELYTFLAAECADHDVAWDCGTGNGQAARELAPYFIKVIATDPSASQIENAVPEVNVEYKVASAEHSGLESESVDLITVAQALHWFKLDLFTTEVRRVAKKQARLAVWTYALAEITPEIDAVTDIFYTEKLGPYWEPERKLVDEGYANLNLPLTNEVRPKFAMRVEWDLQAWLAYLETWSALNTAIKKTGRNPLDEMRGEFQKKWGDPKITRIVSWPLSVRSGAVNF